MLAETNANGPVVVVGAGIIGVSTALCLQRAGRNVILIDRAGPGEGASYGNGGVLASVSVVPVTTPGLIGKAPRMLLDPKEPLFLKWGYLPKLLPFLLRYLKHCNKADVERISQALHGVVGDSLAEHQALAAGTGAEKWIVPCPYQFAYRDRAHFEGDSFGWSLRRARGFLWDELEGAALRAAEPDLSPAIGFVARVNDHGRIEDPELYVKDLAAHLIAKGGQLLRAEATDIARENGRVIGVRAGGETIPCSDVVIAAGVWSGPLAARLGLKAPLESERGYHIDLYEPSVLPRAPSMIAAGKFVMTPLRGRLRLAGIVEFGGLEAPPTRAAFELLLHHARAALPGLSWTEAREWMGHRPAVSDSIPLIGPAPGVAGAWLGFGHHHIGLTAGPRTGRILASLVTGERLNFDLAPYAPIRFH